MAERIVAQLRLPVSVSALAKVREGLEAAYGSGLWMRSDDLTVDDLTESWLVIFVEELNPDHEGRGN